MTLKTFLPSGIIRHNCKRFWWVSALYAFALFLSEPYQLLISLPRLLNRVHQFPDVVNHQLARDELPFLLLIAAAVILGICIMRYLQDGRSATLFHALPLKRTGLYLSGVASGFILLAVPVILNGIILLLMSLFSEFSLIFTPLEVVDWIASQLLTGTATLCFCLLVGVFTGSSVAQFVYVFVISFVPIGTVALFAELLDGWLFGFTSTGINPVLEFLLRLVPMYYPQYLTADPIWWIPVLAGVYIVLFTALGIVFYKKRHVESAGDVVAFGWIRPVFLYGATFLVMLFGTSFVMDFGDVYDGAPNLLVLLLFALIGYAAAKMLLIKSFRILNFYKGYVVFGVLVILGFVVVHCNLFGYGTRVPEAEDITKAYVGTYVNTDWAEDDAILRSGSTSRAVLCDQPEIDMVRNLQRELIAAGKTKINDGTDRVRIYVAYQFVNGRRVVRAYSGALSKLYPIFDTAAAKDSIFPYFRTLPDKIRYLEVISSGALNNTLYGEEKEELVACIRADLDRLSYEEINTNDKLWAAAGMYAEPADKTEEELKEYSMEVGVTTPEGKESAIWFTFNRNFTETMNWLRAKGILKVSAQ